MSLFARKQRIAAWAPTFSLMFLLSACHGKEVPKTSTGGYSEADAVLHLQFARVAFCVPANIESWTCGDMCDAIHPPPLKIRVLPPGSRWDVQGYVARLQDDHCVVAFRGSVDFKNWEADLTALPAAWPLNQAPWCPYCMVHHGFANAYDELRIPMFTAIQDLQCKSIGVAGHSLGGAVATLAALDLSAGFDLDVHTLYTYGSPRVGNMAFVNAFKAAGKRAGRSPAQWRLVHAADPAPHLPPEFLGVGSYKYRHTPQEVFYNEDFSSYKVCDPGNGEDPTCSDSISFVKLMFDVPNLDHLTYLNMTIAHHKLPAACMDVHLATDATDSFDVIIL